MNISFCNVTYRLHYYIYYAIARVMNGGTLALVLPRVLPAEVEVAGRPWRASFFCCFDFLTSPSPSAIRLRHPCHE